MLSVYLLRHGETRFNAEGNRYCGRTDIELTDKGIQQAGAVYHQLKNIQIDAVYSSPLIRARATAEIAAGHTLINTDARITEVDFGSWEGKTKDEFIAEDASLWEAWADDPEKVRAGATGETGRQVIERVDSFYNEMLRKHAGQTILVISHNGINRFYMAFKLGMPIRNYRRIFQENSAVTFFELDDQGEITLKKLNG